MAARKFDVHAHYLPAGLPRPGAPGQYFLGSPMPSWSPEMALDFMDRHGIETQMLSVPMPLPAPAMRQANIYGAELVKRYPGRFGLLAALPLTDVAAAMQEIAYAFDELSADGVILLTNYDGAYLGDAKFDGVFAELNRRGATIFIHPTSPPGFDCVACGRPGPLIEFPFDTCRTVTDLLYAGVFERYTGLKFIVPHAGGVLPTLAPRLQTIGTVYYVPHPESLTPDTIREQLSRLYFDTAIAGSEASIAPVLALTSADHIVFGSDFPPATEPVIDVNIAALETLRLLTEAERDAVFGGARRLFPRFCEEVAPQNA
jgi:predicted TIM-barrel fold metal-dependent hydrolase